MPQPPRRPTIDFAGLFSGFTTALTEMAEDAVKEGVKQAMDGALGVLEENVHGIGHRIAGARSKVTRRVVAAAAPLERGPEVVVEGEPRKRKPKPKRRSARRS